MSPDDTEDRTYGLEDGAADGRAGTPPAVTLDTDEGDAYERAYREAYLAEQAKRTDR
jgi:hypothetical protein